MAPKIIDNLAKAAGQAARTFRDEVTGGPDVPDDQMSTLLQDAGLAEPTEDKPRAMYHDPYAVMDWGGWREKPTPLTYETLKQMSYKTTPISAIIQLRTDQIAQHCKPQQGRYDKGYKVMLRDRRDISRSMTKAESTQAALIERMLETTGFLLPNERPSDRDSFRAFVKKAVRDILIIDQFCFEKIRDRKGRISRFICLPGDTIRPAVADAEHMDPVEMRSRVSHVQIYEDTVIAEFSPDDIAWCPKNVRSDLRVNSFGYSPVEQLMHLVSSWLYGFEYNTRAFTQGSTIKGLLNIKGAIPDRQLKAFRRMWYNMVSGVVNAWRTPILNSEDVQFINMHTTNREMEYSGWMDWLTKLVTAMFGTDPSEINFQFGNTGQKSSMNQSRPREDELVESKDKGLVPLMEHIESAINAHIVWEMNPDFEFTFAGLNAKAERQQREAWDTESKSYKMVDEVRAEQDLPPLPDGSGQIVRDPVWMQMQVQKQQAQQAEDAAAQEGAPGDDGLPELSPGGGDPSLGDEPQEGEQAGPERDDTPDEKPLLDLERSLDVPRGDLLIKARRLSRSDDRIIYDLDLEDPPNV